MIFYQSSQRKNIVEALGKYFPDTKINVLKTFSDTDNNILDMAIDRPKNIGKLILDSGMFSQNNSKTIRKNINLEQYKNFLSDHIGKFDGGAFNYDEIFGVGGTSINYKNQVFLLKNGLNVIPVIQCFKEVQYYCSNPEKYPYVAIGSGCRQTKKDRERIKDEVRKLHKVNIKIHLFAEAAYDFLKDIPVYSSDSKSYLDWTRIRRCCFFDIQKNKEVQLCLDYKNSKGEINKDYYKFHESYEEYETWLGKNFQMEISDLNIDNNLWIVNSYYYLELEKSITDKHTELSVFK